MKRRSLIAAAVGALFAPAARPASGRGATVFFSRTVLPNGWERLEMRDVTNGRIYAQWRPPKEDVHTIPWNCPPIVWDDTHERALIEALHGATITLS